MTCKEYFNSEEVKINLQKQMPPRDLLPVEKKCEGLDAIQWYLFEQIGQFFKSDIA
jgi:hypothetical protein